MMPLTKAEEDNTDVMRHVPRLDRPAGRIGEAAQRFSTNQSMDVGSRVAGEVVRTQAAAFGILLSASALLAQVQKPPAPWRGAGAIPCVGPDGGVYQCPPAPRSIAIPAGRLFDTKTGQMF